MSSWRKVTDELPKTVSKYAQYLCVISDAVPEAFVGVVTFNAERQEFGEWSFAPKPENDVWHKLMVTHWQPFPDLPTE